MFGGGHRRSAGAGVAAILCCVLPALVITAGASLASGSAGAPGGGELATAAKNCKGGKGKKSQASAAKKKKKCKSSKPVGAAPPPVDPGGGGGTTGSSGPPTLCGEISTDRVLSPAEAPAYVITCDVTVASGATLTAAPGTVVKAEAARKLTVEGTLVATGTADAPVTFTTVPDDTAGGDTGGDAAASTPAAGSWAGIDVAALGTGDLTHLSVRYAVNALSVHGAASLESTNTALNSASGLVVDSAEPISIRNPRSHQNGDDGILIRRADNRAAVTISSERPNLRSLAEIYGNGRNGVSVGEPGGPRDATINASIADLDVYENTGIGILVRDQDAGTTGVSLLDNDVYTNGANGIFVGRSIQQFAQNRVHNNALNQWVFDGGGSDPNWAFTLDPGSDPVLANQIYCYTAKQVFGIFAQGNADVTVRHTSFEGGGTGLKDFSAQAGSTISVTDNFTAITVCP